MKENNINNTVCVFEFQKETNNFHSNNNNKNENLKTNFTDIENVKIICNESADLFYVTTNNKAYQLIEGNFIPRCLNKESSVYGNDIIDVTVNFGDKNILTRQFVYLTSGTVDLPEIDLDDKVVKLATGASKKFAFLLTGKVKRSLDLCLLLEDNSMYMLDCNNIYDDSLEFEKVEIIWKYSYLNVYAGDKFIIILNSNFNIEEEESKEKQRMIDLLFKQINNYNPFCDIDIIFE
ncbi:hypothetical protein ABK040_001706 [Willaertia magna]